MIAPRLKANFIADLISHLRQYLIDRGWRSNEISGIDDKHVAIHYFEALRRRIAVMPRVVSIADNFDCPEDLRTGWCALMEKVENGWAINPSLSTRHASLLNQDRLLNDWGIHHFHLGIDVDQKNSNYTARTEKILYALVDDYNFCAIGIFSHGEFANANLLEAIHRNWPNKISHYRLNDFAGEKLTEKQRSALRKKNGNACITMSDGSVYLPTSGGITCAGVSVEAVRNADILSGDIQAIQAEVEEKLVELLPILIDRGYAGEPEIEAKLLTPLEAGMQIFFPKYRVLVTGNLKCLALTIATQIPGKNKGDL